MVSDLCPQQKGTVTAYLTYTHMVASTFVFVSSRLFTLGCLGVSNLNLSVVGSARKDVCALCYITLFGETAEVKNASLLKSKTYISFANLNSYIYCVSL